MPSTPFTAPNRTLATLTPSACLLTLLAFGCGPSVGPAPTTPQPETTQEPAAATEPTDPALTAVPELLTRPLAGDVYWVSGQDDDVRAVFLEIEPMPQPEGEVIGSIELHHSYRQLRLIDEVVAPETVVILEQPELCEAQVTRARRIHTLFTSYDDESAPPNDPLTYLVLDFEGCEEGTAGISGVPRADVRIQSLQQDALTEVATPALVEAVRHVDDGVWGGDPLAASDFRMFDLPAHGVTFVVGAGAWVVRDGVVLTGASPATLIEAGPLVLLELETPSESWLGSLSDFTPRYVPGACEVIGRAAMSVRAGPRPRSPVVASVPTGTRVTANDAWGEWFHVATTPPGWAHQRSLRCETLRVAGDD